LIIEPVAMEIPKIPPSESHRQKCKEYYDRLIEPLRAIAREHGYALGVHGSLARDIDLIAAPWREDITVQAVLAEAIRLKAEEIIGCAFIVPHEENDFPRKKPHGRLCWSFHLGGGPYIDLSVLPPNRK
jgi:hypothetical protein